MRTRGGGARGTTTRGPAPDLELLHEERNNIQHKYTNPSAEDAAFHIDRAVHFLDRFVRDELNIELADYIPSEFLDRVLN